MPGAATLPGGSFLKTGLPSGWAAIIYTLENPVAGFLEENSGTSWRQCADVKEC
jgi:hypothetical protein